MIHVGLDERLHQLQHTKVHSSLYTLYHEASKALWDYQDVKDYIPLKDPKKVDRNDPIDFLLSTPQPPEMIFSPFLCCFAILDQLGNLYEPKNILQYI
ncbi:hypothetical protein [Swingsia samuiensis]|uniref:Uncharacterized protein n=1 Tax=Swingsia samuiensis TaxID=1293412 RepID=A0A4Y6UJK6_9PROT|nr:hypothetical protein [Swingsia samuiensis]QDH17783.1 hypothetical protein E3D00_09540 [Swingsia samuiensis]